MADKKSITAENLIALGEFFTIKKHEGGSIRLAVKPSIKNEQFEVPESVKKAKLSWDMLWQALPGIASVKPRLLIMSVDIQYDVDHIQPTLWEAWEQSQATPELVGYIDAAIESLLSQLAAQ